jgi:uncharacterized protein (UPF0332 family)
MERARASLRAAELLRDAGLPEDAVTRAHQATVHAERALLATEKRSPQDLRSVHRLAAQHFLSKDLLDRAHVDRLDRLFTLRERADDQPARDVSPEECGVAVTDAVAFVCDVSAFLEAQGHRR